MAQGTRWLILASQLDVYVVIPARYSCSVIVSHGYASCTTQNPGSAVVAAGCLAERVAEQLADMPEVDLIGGNRNKDRIVEAVEQYRWLVDPAYHWRKIGPQS